jgi:hypothetical protein
MLIAGLLQALNEIVNKWSLSQLKTPNGIHRFEMRIRWPTLWALPTGSMVTMLVSAYTYIQACAINPWEKGRMGDDCCKSEPIIKLEDTTVLFPCKSNFFLKIKF